MERFQGKPRPRVFIIGIDGATFDLIKPWAMAGKLPTFKQLLDEGVHGELESAVPPVTPPAWTSFMTGMNPGKHGIYDFLEPRPGRYEMQYCCGRSRRALSLWGLLNAAGLSVGVMNVPMTYPPEPVNGYMISGMDTPDEGSDFTYPRALKGELKHAVGGVQIDIRHLGNMRTDARRDDTLRALAALEAQRTRVALYMLEKHPTDVVMLYYNATDQVQHHFWHYHDPSHPFYDAQGAARYGDAIFQIYKTIDDHLAEIWHALPDETVILAVSDHGGGPVSDREIFLNRYLERLGLLHRRPANASVWSAHTWFAWGVRQADTMLRATLSQRQKTRLAKWRPGAREKLESFLAFGDIDWSRTVAYAPEISASSPSIWINLKGRQPRGTVEPGAAYEALLAEIEEQLLKLKDPDTGEAVVSAVYRKEAIYHGDTVEQAPDLTLAWWEGKGFLARPSFPCLPDAPVVQRRRKMVAGADWSGNHTLWGILMLYGKPFKAGQQLQSARIIDVAPTLLKLLGVPIPEDMDGCALDGAFTEAFQVTTRRTYRRGREAIAVREQTGYSTDEAEKIRQRLRSLGYIE